MDCPISLLARRRHDTTDPLSPLSPALRGGEGLGVRGIVSK